MRISNLLSRFFWMITLLLIYSFSNARVIYVDQQLSEDCIGNYSIQNRDCNGTDGNGYKTIQSASAASVPGTTILIRGGVYSEQLNPQISGEKDGFITFKNYGDETVEITGATLTPAVWINQKNYIIIDGMVIRDVKRWLNALGCSNLLILNCIFRNATDSGGSSKTGIFLQSCDHIKILNNIIDECTQDNIGMVDCDYNLIEGNTITRAKHTLWALKCSNYNIIRKNYFHNKFQKIGEIYDCDNVGFGEESFPKITSLDDTKYNVVENNIFAYTASSGNHSPYAGIQCAGQHCIIRNNVFYECKGPAISLAFYANEAKNNYGNRISHNVFYNNEFGGLEIAGSDDNGFYDQKLKNNVFFKNKFIQHDLRWLWYNELDNKPVQIFTGRNNRILIENNNLFSSKPNELYVIAYGSRFLESNNSPQPLHWWESNYPQVYKNNLQVDPGFINSSGKDFHLQQNSPMIDAGVFLAHTTNSGTNSTMIKVDDAGWFIDGFGIVSGDTIQLEEQSDYIVIQSVDYVNKLLTTKQPITWKKGQGVSLKYVDKRPDIGAFEYIAE